MQSLEDSLKEMTDQNEELKQENQQLKDKISVLEVEVTFSHLILYSYWIYHFM